MSRVSALLGVGLPGAFKVSTTTRYPSGLFSSLHQGRPSTRPLFTRGPLVARSPPLTSAGGGGGGLRIGASKGYGGDGGGDSGGSGQRRPIIGLTLAYAAFVAGHTSICMVRKQHMAVGGVMGYRKAGSKNSLASSLAVAAGLAAASYQMKTNPASYLGIYSALVIVVALGGYMAYGWWKKRKTFPQGVTAALSLALASTYAIVLKGPQAV